MRTLITDRLRLRPLTGGDADALVELDSDPQVMFFLTGGRSTPAAEIRDVVLPRYLAYARGATGYGYWAAEDRVSGAFLGWFALAPDDDHDPDEPHLGYRLRRAAWGRGLATEGAGALVALAFDTLGARRVLADTMVVNAASRRVLAKCGLTVRRVYHADWPDRIPGGEQGDVEYELTRGTWQARSV